MTDAVKTANTVTALWTVFMGDFNPPLREDEFYQRALRN
jgi:hypothetical protein